MCVFVCVCGELISIIKQGAEFKMWRKLCKGKMLIDSVGEASALHTEKRQRRMS